jgi:hypothetical protein
MTVAAPPLSVAEQEPEDVPLCLGCLRPLVPATTLCAHCGGPASANATVLPFERLLLEANLFARASHLRAPTFAIVVGTWIVALMFAVGYVVVLPVVIYGAVRTTAHWRAARRDGPRAGS